VIIPGINAARKLAVQVLSPGLVDFAHLDGPHDIGIVEIGPNHVGATLGELALEAHHKVKLLAVRRGSHDDAGILTGLTSATELREGDRLYLLGAEPDVIRAGRVFA
jgi:Trk K+ transport system NAD-binding subunit